MRALIAVAAVFGLLFVAVIAPKLQQARRERATEASRNDLKQIMLALHNYHERHRTFPPAYVVGPDGRRWHSWRALILKDLDPELAVAYRFNEPWNGPNNRKLLNRAPKVLQSDRHPVSGNATSYFAVVGPQTMWPAFQSTKIRDIADGTSNTLAIIENGRSDIGFLEPRDLLPGDVFRSFTAAADHDPGSDFLVGMADGAVVTLDATFDRGRLAGLLTPSGISEMFEEAVWPEDLTEEIPSQQFLPLRDIDDLATTTIVAVPTEPLDHRQNTLWCQSLAMAWGDMNRMASEPVKMLSPHSVAEQLSAHPVPKDNLAPEAVFRGVSPGDSTSDRKMLRNLRRKFPDVDIKLHDLKTTLDRRLSLRLLAVIRKQMPFETRFDRFGEPLSFRTAKQAVAVRSFGRKPSGNSESVLQHQLQVVDDRGDEDFILRLTTTGPQKDHIILARVSPQESLEATWQSVESRMQAPNPEHKRPHLDGNETLRIPVLDFSLSKMFDELTGPVSGFGGAAEIQLVYQDIRLRLDETGAELLSAAEIGLVSAFEEVEYEPERIRQFVFDHPFLVAFIEPNATAPYFLGWIADTELMEAFE